MRRTVMLVVRWPCCCLLSRSPRTGGGKLILDMSGWAVSSMCSRGFAGTSLRRWRDGSRRRRRSARCDEGRGKRCCGGEIEYASKGTVHMSLNESKKPARVLVVLLKER